MQLALISATNILWFPFVILSTVILYIQQDAAETAQEVQSFVVKWFPLIVIIGLAIICGSLVHIASTLSDASKDIAKVANNIESLDRSISSHLSEIKKSLEEKRG
jgi:cell division protein FtsL